ncbi:ABC transporter permease [Vagococcus sp. BWB3-3]|uniref:Transport permease protein n=1 Tax=Vagococcus allomyrinae TaxID=2794353 RepID=A0A940PEY2_9ENTE|nr:ABC transporter permease [Vagococcus allomyrinae]MBP1042291.1 ABC transporter permease [Vagococcus allomyrinae]
MKTKVILKRTIKWRFHHGFTIVVTILQPMLWLVLYTQVAKASMVGLGIDNYVTYVFSGLLFLVSFGACSSGGMMNYLMKGDGSFYRIIKSPVKRSAIVLGQVIESVLCSMLEILFMFFVALLLGLQFHFSMGAILLSLVIILLVNFCVANATYLLSLILPNEIIYETLMNAIVLPLFFLSPALFPVDNLSGILKGLIGLNPFTHAITTIRSLMLTGQVDGAVLVGSISLFLVLGVALFMLALRKLNNVTNY